MLKRIAKETTIHGVEDTWRANWVGRVFFLTVFASCFILMGFQLEGLFHAYISEAVGTRVTSTTKYDTVETPSIYYCNKNWLPKSKALWDYKPITIRDPNLDQDYLELYRECVHMARYNLSFDKTLLRHTDEVKEYYRTRPIQHCKPFLEYWKSLIIQELVNAIVGPLEDRNYDYRDRVYEYRRKRPELSVMTRKFAAGVLEDHIQSLLNSEFSHSVKATVEKLVLNVTLDNRRDRKGCTTCSVYKSSSSVTSLGSHDGNDVDNRDGNLPHYLRYFLAHTGKIPSSGPFAERYPFHLDYYGIASNNTLHPSGISTNLDGICFEYAAGPQYLKTNLAVGRKVSHVVIHLGGLVHQLRTLSSRASENYNATPESYDKHLLDVILKYPKVVDDDYYTNFAISVQNEPGLYFSQKTRVDSIDLFVSVKYWKKSYTHLNTKAWPCRPAPWTELDQAHCNQELTRYHQEETLCETYLPASGRYPETPITNKTCIYDHTGIFKDIASALSDLTIGSHSALNQSQNNAYRLSNFGPSRITSDQRRDVISRLTKGNTDCPRPCSRTLFNYETSYPSSIMAKRGGAVECQVALGYWLAPKTLPSHHFRSQLDNLIHRLFYLHYGGDRFCSVIEYEQTEAHGEVSEEYLLYGFADLAANLGGTIGLWIGASVISVVQLLHLGCLEKLFRDVSSKIMVRNAEKLSLSNRTVEPAK